MLTPDSERLVVKFLVAALGQPREQARGFAHQIPDKLHGQLLAMAQAWSSKSCSLANGEFVKLMAAVPTPNLEVPQQAQAAAPVRKLKAVRKVTIWTPERRAKLSRKMKKKWKETHPGVMARSTTHTKQSATVHDKGQTF